MRIQRVVLKNYRQFRDLQIDFPKPTGANSDLHILIGRNGTGKTNLLNAINWCLYGDEPHLSGESSKLPLPNLNGLEESRDSKYAEVKVELWVGVDDAQTIIFTRTAMFHVQPDFGRQDLPPREVRLEVRVLNADGSGNTEIVRDEDALSYVERFVPSRIREFFFFDGEMLDKYFRESSAQNVRHAVFVLAQIDVLERIEGRLRTVLQDLRKEAGKKDPRIEETRQRFEEAQDQLTRIQQDIEKCNAQITLARNRLKEYEGKLAHVPDVESLEEQRRRLKTERSKKTEMRDAKRHERQELLYKGALALMPRRAIEDALTLIHRKRQEREIPPHVDDRLLQETLESGECKVCGSPLDDQATAKVETLLGQVRHSSAVTRELAEMEPYLQRFVDYAREFGSRIRLVTADLETYEKDLEKIARAIQEIDRQLAGYDAERIRQWAQERRRWEQALEENLQRKGGLQTECERLQKQLEQLSQQLDQEIRREEENRRLSRQMRFCSEAEHVVRQARSAVMQEIRERIVEETKRIFFDLVWKKQTFQDIAIGEDYSISLFHVTGLDCLGTVSAAERQLLALSFMLALHEVSGFDSPILIDTPVARVSDEHRENLGQVLVSVSEGKQTMLLLTPSEYSDEIARCLDPRLSSRRELRLTPDEREARLEETGHAQRPR